jgi:hypothetical protein
MREKRDRTVEDQLRTAIQQSDRRREPKDAGDSPREVMRRVSERVGRRIEEIFSKKPTHSN